MIDKQLEIFRKQLSEYDQQTDNKNENNMTENKEHFYMPITDVFYISGHGYVLVGLIESGEVHHGDEVILNNGIKSFVNAIESGSNLIESASAGQSVGLLVGSISKKHLTNFDNLVVEGIDTERNHCEISVTEQSPLKGNGIIVKGKVISGTINVGDPIIISLDINGNIFNTSIVDGIEVDGKKVGTATEGQSVTLNFKGLTMRTKCDEVIKR